MIKLFTISLFFFGFFAINSQAQTYSWNRTDSADFQVATNWTPNRTTPSATDNLVFSNGAANTIAYNVSTQTIGSLWINTFTSVKFYSGAAATLTIGGGNSPALQIEFGSTLTCNASASANAIVMNISTGNTGSISGNLTMMSTVSGTNHRFQAADANAVSFVGPGIFTCGPNTAGSIFGSGTAPSGLNSIVFPSGSRLIFKSGANPFGASSPNSVVNFQTGSTLEQQTTSGLSLSGRSMANLEINAPSATFNVTGGGTCTMDNLTVTDGTFNYNLTGRTNIRGNISVASGKTLAFNPATADTLYLNGFSPQIIGGTGTMTFSSLTRVIVTNAGGIFLNRNVTLQGELNLQGGLIYTGANTLTLGANILNLGTLVRTSGTIIGNFSRWFANSVVSNVLFPVGTAINYRPATISFTVNPFSGGTVTISHTDGTDGSDLAAPFVDGAYLIERRSNMFWTYSSTIADGVYTLSVDGNGQTGITDVANLRAIYSPDGTVFTAPGTHVNGSGGAVANRSGLLGGVTGNFYLGGNNANNPLPVELDNFVATTIKNEVILDWFTGHEQNNQGFEVQRAALSEKQMRTDADLNFEAVAFIPSKGNSNIVQGYKYIDGNLAVGRFAYRLKQVDYNGNHTYYLLNNEITVSTPNKFTIGQNYPNPFNPTTNISYEMPFDGNVKIVVFDNIGREVKTLINGNVNAGYNTVQFNAAGLPSGIYFYRVNAASGSDKFEKVFKMMLVK